MPFIKSHNMTSKHVIYGMETTHCFVIQNQMHMCQNKRLTIKIVLILMKNYDVFWEFCQPADFLSEQIFCRTDSSGAPEYIGQLYTNNEKTYYIHSPCAVHILSEVLNVVWYHQGKSVVKRESGLSSHCYIKVHGQTWQGSFKHTKSIF